MTISYLLPPPSTIPEQEKERQKKKKKGRQSKEGPNNDFKESLGKNYIQGLRATRV